MPGSVVEPPFATPFAASCVPARARYAGARVLHLLSDSLVRRAAGRLPSGAVENSGKAGADVAAPASFSVTGRQRRSASAAAPLSSSTSAELPREGVSLATHEKKSSCRAAHVSHVRRANDGQAGREAATDGRRLSSPRCRASRTTTCQERAARVVVHAHNTRR